MAFVKMRCIYCNYEGYGDPRYDYWCPRCTNPTMLPYGRTLVEVPDVITRLIVQKRTMEGAKHEKE